MTRLPFVDRDSDDPEIRELLSWVEQVEGAVPNHFLLELHFPPHFKAWLKWVRTLWDEGELSFLEIQHVGVAISKANRCPYCAGSFCSVLEHGGGAGRQEVEDFLARDVAALSGRERALVEFALLANTDPHAVTQADIDGLRELGLTDRGVVQLVWVVNMFASSNRVNTVLDTASDDGNPYQAMAEALQREPPSEGSGPTRSSIAGRDG
ncbi:MAG: peroxidase-related enzyme [Solirubrobacterales bacterium]